MYNKPISSTCTQKTHRTRTTHQQDVPKTQMKYRYTTCTGILLLHHQLFVEYSDYLNHYYFNVKKLLSFLYLMFKRLVIAAALSPDTLCFRVKNWYYDCFYWGKLGISCGRVNVKMNAMSVMEWQLCYLGKVRMLFYLCANDLLLLLL